MYIACFTFQCCGSIARFFKYFELGRFCNEDVTYEERPICVLDTRNQVFRGKTIPLVKILRFHHGMKEAMWECESEIRTKYPDLSNLFGTLI